MYETLHPMFLEPHDDSKILFINLDPLSRNERRYQWSVFDKLEKRLGVEFKKVKTVGRAEIVFDQQDDPTLPDGTKAGGYVAPRGFQNVAVYGSTDPIHYQSWSRYVWLHELGHALGLGHVDHEVHSSHDSVMSYDIQHFNKFFTQNDVARLREIWDPITGRKL